MDVIFVLSPETSTTLSYDKVATIAISFIALVVSIYSLILSRRESTRKERASIHNSARNVKFLLGMYHENITSDEAYQAVKPDFDNFQLHRGWMPEFYETLITDFFIAYNTAKNNIRMAEQQLKWRDKALNTKKEVDTDSYNSKYKEHHAVFEENLQEAEQLLDDIMEFVKPKNPLIKRVFK